MNLSRFTYHTLFSLSAIAAASALLNAEELSVYELTPIHVTAPRFNALDSEIAAQVQLIDQSEIAASGASNLVELLKYEANLYFRSESGNSARSQISMGGFGENSGQRVLILLDGHRLNTADLGQINWLSIPLGLIESVEVIKGGQSALYGNNASSGVIKIITRRPTQNLSGELHGSFGSYDAYNGRATVTGRFGDFGFSAHAEHDEADAFRDNSQYESDGAGLRLDWDRENRFTAYGSISGVSSEYGLPGSLPLAVAQSNPKQTNTPIDFSEDDSVYTRAGVSVRSDNGMELGIDGGYTKRELYTFFDPFIIEQDYEIWTVSPSVKVNNGSFTGLLGVDYYNDNIDALFGGEPIVFERETLAGFASAQYSVSEDWILSGTLRVENVETNGNYTVMGTPNVLDSVEDTEYAWSLGLVRSFETQWRVYGTVRRFYRYPAIDEYIISDFVSSAIVNPNLQPEWGHEVELGFDWYFQSLVLSGRVFHQWMRDEVFLDYLTFLSYNLDATERTGVDLTAQLELTDWLNLNLGYMWVNAEMDDSNVAVGKNVPLVPEHQARIVANCSPMDGLSVALGATYTGSNYIGGDYANALAKVDDYVLLDLNVRYAINSDFEVFATIDNLLDEEYISYGISSAFGAPGYYPGTGISGKIGVRYQF